jgi:hypothetical protein
VRVVINPVFAGTGAKIKTVEALSHLRPIVTWPTGVEGLPADIVTLCDTVHDWFEFGARVTARLSTEHDEAFSADDCRRITEATSPQNVYAELVAKVRRRWEQRIAMDAKAAS